MSRRMRSTIAAPTASGRVAGERQRQMHVFRTNNLQPASAITQRGDDRRLFGRDRGACGVGQIDGREQTHPKCQRLNANCH